MKQIGVILLGNTVAVRRDCQDSWILEGLEISFISFVVAYSLAFFSEGKIRSMVALAVTGRALIRTSGDLANCDQQGDTGWTIAGNVGDMEFVENNTNFVLII